MRSHRRPGLRRMLPRFWRAAGRLGPYATLKSYPKAFALSVALLSATSILPVILGVFLDYRRFGRPCI